MTELTISADSIEIEGTSFTYLNDWVGYTNTVINEQISRVNTLESVCGYGLSADLSDIRSELAELRAAIRELQDDVRRLQEIKRETLEQLL